MGLDGWVVDRFDAPAPIKAYLCEYGEVHQIPYSNSARLSREQMEMIERHRTNGQITFKRFIVGDVIYSVRGAHGETTTQSSTMRPSQMLSGGADPSRRTALEHKRDDANRKLERHQASMKQYYKDLNAHQERIKALNEKKVGDEKSCWEAIWR